MTIKERTGFIDNKEKAFERGDQALQSDHLFAWKRRGHAEWWAHRRVKGTLRRDQLENRGIGTQRVLFR